MMSPSVKAISLLIFLAAAASASEQKPLKVLFLGDNAGHQPNARFDQLCFVFKERGILLTYTDKVSDLNETVLNHYDGLMIYANHLNWKPENEQALISYVRSGKGFIPVHCASYCFTHSQKYIDLVGAQFRSHTHGVFRTTTVSSHPIMNGCDSFSSWDETYVHHKHNGKGRTVLEIRTDGDVSEPWTWVREEGKGRVFYTAWGHDHRTWSHSGFHALLERGTRWACGQSLERATVYVDRPRMKPVAKDVKPFEYAPAKLPHYVPSENWGTMGEPVMTMQKPLSAAESVKHYSVPEGFEMKPFVTEDKLGGGKPICMTWDERGRLWLALTYDYPNEMQAEGQGHDRIVICEDENADGECDNVRVFAQKLSIPTSILTVHGGLLVHQAPHTLFLKDVDGDGHADTRQILMTGWGTQDTHAGPSNMRYGPDHWIYSMCGYSGFNGIVKGERIRFGQGLFRFKPIMKNGKLTIEKLEFLRSTNNNSWGIGFNDHGELFGSTANGCPLVHLAIPNRYYEKVKAFTPGVLQNIALDNHVEPIVKSYRQVDWHGGFTAAAACTPYTGNTYPSEYRNRVVFVCEPTAHLVAAMVLEPRGTSYVARYGWNLCASDDDWAAPIDAQIGPDGNVWIIDWYNIIVQHNPTPQGYQTGRGNAYEIEYRDKKYGRIYRILNMDARSRKPITLANADSDTLNQIAMTDGNMFWRTHASRIRHERSVASNEPVKSIDVILVSANPRERLQAILRMADDASENQYGRLIAKQIGDINTYRDDALRDAVIIAGSVHSDRTVNELLKLSKAPVEARPIIHRISRHFASQAGRNNSLQVLSSLDSASDPEIVNAVIDGMAVGWPRASKPVLSEEERSSIARLLRKLKGPTLAQFLKLATLWGVSGLEAQFAEIAKGLLAKAADDKASEGDRLIAVQQILELQPDDDDVTTKLVVVATEATPSLARGIFEALAISRSRSLGTAVTARMKELPPAVRPAALRILLARIDSTKTFLEAVEKGELRFDFLSLDQKTALAGHPDSSIRERTKKILALGGGLPDADRQKVIEQFLPIIKKSGDVALGRKAFAQHCAKCHKHGNEGLTIGPDLTGFAVHPKGEILIHLLDPSRSVEGNFKQYTTKLEDGRVITGLLASETKTIIEILDAENKRHAIPRDEITDLKESSKSIMPEGFEKQMTVDEMTNLLEFLTHKGRYVQVPLDKVATLTSAKGMFYGEKGTIERLVLKDWKPREINGVPFKLIDPQEGRQKNVILLYSPNGEAPPRMPKSVSLPCNMAAGAIHFLSGVGGWAGANDGTICMTVRLHYDDGTTEDHDLKNGVHFADYIRRVDVKESSHAIDFLGRQQMRYLCVRPKRRNSIKTIELVKGPNRTSPIVMAVTVETP